MKLYEVTIPIGGHIIIEVEAESPEQAIEKALEADMSTADIDQWEVLEEVGRGNVLYFPKPWEVRAEDLGEVE